LFLLWWAGKEAPTKAVPLERVNIKTITGLVYEFFVQGASRETDVFEINITPLIFSVEFIQYHDMIRYYMPF